MTTWLLPRLDLTFHQLQVVEMPPESHRVVFGPPGSGKTQALIHRAGYLSETYHVPPDRFRVFVFTNVVKEYIRSGLQFLNIPDDTVSTFDHWCRLFYEEHVSHTLPWSSQNRTFDWDKIRSEVLETLKQKKGLQKRLEFVLVDEGQDLTPQVYQILSLAAHHITVFADPQQKIFDEGSSEEIILEKLGLRKRNAALLGAFRNAPYVAQLASHFIADKSLRREYLANIRTMQQVKERPLCFVASSFKEEMDRLADVVRQREYMNERIGIIVATNKQVFGLAKGLEERGVKVEKAVRKDYAGGQENGCDFNSLAPKIATYHSAKGLTFDSVMMPRLSDSSFPRIRGISRQRILFVGMARATQWVYVSAVKGKPFAEMALLEEAEANNELIVQYGNGQEGSGGPGITENEEDDFSVL